jgi:hypothetical protein
VQPEVRLRVLIPTRNRARLAIAAVKSVIAAGVPATVIVSDNSTREDERELLAGFCSTQDARAVKLVAPPVSMSMSEHWDWAMGLALGDPEPSHYTVLTDRMIFKPGHLSELLQQVALFPRDVLSYNYDKLDDSVAPIHLELEPWSGKVLVLDPAHMLLLSSRGIYSNALPRMLNTVVPRPVVEAIRQRFGTVFASISPDVCFAYRCLAVVDRLLYFDKAVLIQYAVNRSQGLNYARGIRAPEVVDFAAMLGTDRPNFSCAPIPSLQTVGNATFHEYAFVRTEAGSPRFPEIDRWNYLGSMAWDSRALLDRRWAAEVEQALEAHGWRRWDNARWLLQRAVPAILHDPGRLLRPLGHRLSARFTTGEEALAYASKHPRRKSRSWAHQWQLQPQPLSDGSLRRKGVAKALMPE